MTKVAFAIDDETDYLFLIRRAFERTVREVELRTFNSAEAALSYILGEGEYGNRELHPLPRLILIDLKMPRLSGFEFLKQMGDIQLHPRPFLVVLSSSSLQQDISKSYALGADFFETKPANLDGLCKLVKILADSVS